MYIYIYGTFSFVLSTPAAGPRHQKEVATGTGHYYAWGPLELGLDPRVHPKAPFCDRLEHDRCRDGRCPPSEKNISRCHSLAFTKDILGPRRGPEK